MAETLLQKAERLGMQPAGKPVATSTETLTQKAQRLGMQPATPSKQEEGDGFFASLVKDPIKTLLVKPADRFAEAVGRTGVLGDKIKTGYEAMSDAGESRSFAGIEVEPQKAFGQGGAKQIAGDALKSASYLYTGGRVPGVASLGIKGQVGRSALQGSKVGAVGGGAYGAGEALQDANAGFGDVAGGALKGAAIGGATGGILGAATPLAVRAVANQAAKRKQNITNTVGQVLQGEKYDQKVGQEVFSTLDTEGVKTYKELKDRAQEKIDTVRDSMDRTLDTNQTRKKLNELKYKDTIAIDGVDKTIEYNYVKDALDQLKAFYTKINSQEDLAIVRAIERKARQEGLTAREINNLARIHGRDLNAFNANGELASGLGKQAAENTREGVKNTARAQFGNKVIGEADKEMSKLIRVRKLAEEMEEKVNDLQQKLQKRSLGAKAGRLAIDAFDLLSGGFIKGAARSLFTPRGAGNHTLNALDLESKLQKNLKLLSSALQKDVPEATIIQRLEQIIKENGGQVLPSPRR